MRLDGFLRVWVAFCLVLSGAFWLGVFGHRAVCQQNGLPVVNVDTGLEYTAIQAAIDAAETLDGHVIRVDSGVYRERVSVNKSLSLVGKDRSSTVIDGYGGTVVSVKSASVEIRGFTIRNGTFGILVDHADGAKIIGNLVSSGSYGIRLYHSKNAQVTGNRVSEFRFFGIDVDSSGNSTLRDNSMVANRYNFGVDGDSLFDFLNDIDLSNTVNGKPVRYLVNQRDLLIDSLSLEDTGYLGLVNSTNIEVEDLDVRDNKQGLLFAFVANSSIVGVNAVDNWNGVYVAHSRDVSVSWTTANYNFDYGIKFFNSSRSAAISNNADYNGWAGIGLFGSSGSLLDKNEANFNAYNVHLVFTNNSVITRNNASGLAPEKPVSYSIAVYYSHNNRIYHNSFSTTLFYVESRNGTRFAPRNIWDNGYEGNHWLYYGGRDNDHDGISDTVYTVGEDNVDNFPLKGRFWDFIVLSGGRLHEIAVISNSTVFNFVLDPDKANISMTVIGRNATMGFCRIAVPNSLIQSLPSSNMSFVFTDARTPVLVRNWTDDANHYWYFSYVHSGSPVSEGSSWWPFVLLLGFFAGVILVGVVLLVVFSRRRARSK